MRPARTTPELPIPRRILVVQLRRLGDVVLTSALLKDLRHAYPSATIDLLTEPKAAELVRGNPYVSEIVPYDRAASWRMLRDIRRRKYDAILDLQSSPRTALLAWCSGATRRVGWKIRGPWQLVYTDRIPRDATPPEYTLRRRQRFLESLGATPISRVPALELAPDERTWGEAVLRTRAGRTASRVGFVVSTAAPSAQWPVDRFAAAAEALASLGIVPIVFGTHGDADLVTQCVAQAPHAVRCDVAGLREFASTIAALDVLVSADTGPAHIATALGVPTVTLYGPSKPAIWNPALPTTVAVTSPRLTCRRCAQGFGRGLDDHTCMPEITVERVLDGVRTLVPAQRVAARA